MSDQPTLFDDPTIAQEERDLFGDDLRPSQLRLDREGDYIHGRVVSVERDVDLKTGFAPVDILTIEGISGVHKGGTERVQQGRHYAIPVMHATLKNQLDSLDPQPADNERIAVRRGRDFRSTQGPSEGKMLAGYLVKMPDRAALGDAPAEPEAKAGSSTVKGEPAKAK